MGTHDAWGKTLTIAGATAMTPSTVSPEVIERVRDYVETFIDERDDAIIDRDQGFGPTMGDLRALLAALSPDNAKNPPKQYLIDVTLPSGEKLRTIPIDRYAFILHGPTETGVQIASILTELLTRASNTTSGSHELPSQRSK